MVWNNKNYPARCDYNHAMQVIDPVRFAIEQGKYCYMYKRFEGVEADASVNIFVQTGSKVTKAKVFYTSNYSMDIYFYKNPTVDNSGNLLDCHNFNGNVTDESETMAYSDPSVNTQGTEISQGYVPAGDINPAKGGAGSSEQEFSRFLEPNTKYLITVYNRGTGASTIFIDARVTDEDDFQIIV